MKYFILAFCQAATDPSLKKGNEHIPVTMPLSTWTKTNTLTSLVIPLP